MRRPVITLLTDFGIADTFVGQMKGVLLSRCPDAAMVDLTHEVPPQSIRAGAYHLAASWSWFPDGTVHLAVVDPGVGTDRRPLAIEFRGHRFVLPDNGLISAVLGGELPDRAVEIKVPVTEHDQISRTFHGRDVFAPAAAAIAAGAHLDQIGTRVDPSSIVRLDVPIAQRAGGTITGVIVLVDRFGNCITNIDSSLIAAGDRVTCVRSGGFAVDGLSEAYQAVEPGGTLAVVSCMDTVELAIRDGDAAAQFGLHAGMRVVIDVERRS